MGKRIFILSFCIILVFLSFGFAKNKRYHVKSGVVEYKISANGSIFGMKSSEEGTARLVFKDYGNLELREENSKSVMMGKEKTRKEMYKIEDGTVYSVDYENNVIVKQDIDELKSSQNKDFAKTGEDYLKAMNAQKIGAERILGNMCDIWQAGKIKMWIYKGVVLKTEANVMGINRVEVATKAKFNTRISNTEFKLPNFPVKTMEEMMNSEGMDGSKQGEKPSPEQMKQMLKNLFGGQKKQ